MTGRRRAGDVAKAVRRGVQNLTPGDGSEVGQSDPPDVGGVETRTTCADSAQVVEPVKGPRMSKYTALLDLETATAFDELALRARRVKGRKVEKSELVRALILLAADDSSLSDQIIGELPDEVPSRNGRGTR